MRARNCSSRGGFPRDTRGPISKRLYMNTDVVAWVSLGWVKFQEPMRGDDMVVLGRESDWLKAPLPLACGRRHGHYFARVLDSTADSRGAVTTALRL